MKKRTWEIEWKVCPQFDGMDRLGRAVRFVIDLAVDPSGPQPIRRSAPGQGNRHDADKVLKEDSGHESTSSGLRARLHGAP